jgi:hypothetical protein
LNLRNKYSLNTAISYRSTRLKFSEREGISKPKTQIQVDNIDEELRNRLWNSLDVCYWRGMGRYSNEIEGDYHALFTRIWHNYFKKPLDTLSYRWDVDYRHVRDYFFKCHWFDVYNFIEFVATAFPEQETNATFKKTVNVVLEEELSAYRFVGNKIVRMTSKEEILEIEEALETPFMQINTHMENALKLMSDKKSPDYRNSIKESISAVEATCNLLACKKVTLGQCLKDVKEKIGLHGALEKAFSSLYGYTSEAEGIRHALMDEPTLSFEDAKFMLVSCSAFVNYLLSKASKAGLKMS